MSYPLLPLVAAVTLVHAPLAAQIISHQLFDSTAGTLRDNFTGVRGTVFQASEATNRVVTHLGYYDSGSDGLQSTHRVGVYAATPAGAGTGALLAEVTIPAGTNAFLENGYRWVSLPSPLTLEAKTSYVLAAEVTASSGDPYPDATTRVWNRYYVGYHANTSRAARSSTNAWPGEPETQAMNNAAYGAANLGLALSPRPYRLMPLGDSITAGYTDNPNWKVPFQFGYRSGLFSLLSSNGIPFQFVGNSLEPWNGVFGLPTNQPTPDLRLVAQDQHEGYGGQGTAYVAQNLRGWLANDRPDIVLLMIGINDIAAGQTGQPTSVQTALSNIVQIIVTNRPSTHVIVAQIIPYATAYTSAIYEYNDYIRSTLVPAFAARGHRVTTVDQCSHFVTDPAGLSADKERYANGINHPDARTYAKMAETWFAGIQAVLSGGPTVTLSAPAATQEAGPGTVLAVTASSTPGAGGEVMRLELLVNGVLQSEANGSSLATTWQVPVRGAHRLTVRAFDAEGNSGERSVYVLGTDPSTGPGGVAHGLQVWLKAEAGVVFGSGKSVVRWRDQSGQINDASQLSATLQPKYVEGLFGSGPGLRFDGTRFLTSTNGMSIGSYTKIVRFFISHTGTVNNLLSSSSGGSASARGHSLLFGTGQQTLKMSHSGNFAVATTNAPLGQAVTVLATYDANSSAGEIYLDGFLCGSGMAEGDNTMTSYQVGALAGASRLSGAVSEVMIYDRVLTPAERQAIFGYFDDKYRTPFELWQKQSFAPGDPRAAPGFDASGDGIANAVKYALGLDPLADNAGSDHLPHVRLADRTVEVTYRRATGRPDVVCHLESSPDLQTWTPVADTSVGVAGSIDTRSYSVLVAPDTSALFLRLRVLLPG
ncbi:MAG TPA: GDSL-type esterase/lipase family protein [Verrucomicrobiota bacterium]|nr:GDSL-type esterase/lipase family protein [Verrucomicrobiota bacterium]